MARLASVAASLALAITAGAPGRAVEQAESMEALRADDECSAGDEACVLNALQLRGVRLAAADDGFSDPFGVAQIQALAEAGKKKKGKKKDITLEQAEEFEEQIIGIMKDINIMDKKLYYLDEDLTSLNHTLFNLPQKRTGVNGTWVVWTDHEPTWYPTFALLETGASRSGDHPELPKANIPGDKEPEYIEYDDEGEDDEDKADEEWDDIADGSLEADARARKRKKKGKGKGHKNNINQHKKVKAEMMYQLNRMAEFWSGFTTLQGKIKEMNEYITSNVRAIDYVPVLAQMPPGPPPGADGAADDDDDDQDEEPAKKTKKQKKHKMKCKGKGRKKKCKVIPFLEDDIIAGIEGAQNASKYIWETVGKVDLEMETTKRRVKLWMAGEPVTTTTTLSTTTTSTTTEEGAETTTKKGGDDEEYDDDDDDDYTYEYEDTKTPSPSPSVPTAGEDEDPIEAILNKLPRGRPPQD